LDISWAEKKMKRLIIKQFAKKIAAHKIESVAMFLLAVIVISVIVLPYFVPYQPSDQALNEAYQKPSARHWFGTDKFGRDVFVRFLYGGRISLFVAFFSVALAMLIGLPYGLFTGYLGGRVDAFANWIVNLFMAFPQFFLLLTIVAIIDSSSFWWVIVAIGLLSWMDVARIVRNQTLSIKESDFILAEVVLGVPKKRILFRHILPNLIAPVIVAATLMAGNVILIESALSFIGFGVQPPMPSWGNIINEGREVLLNGWWLSVFPGLGIVVTVISLNVLGEKLQKRFSVAE